MKSVLCLSAPPFAGKDTFAEYLTQINPSVQHVKFARTLKQRTHALYGLEGIPHDHFEKNKDKPNPLFYGITPRQAYINLSEKLMKPVHGNSVWFDILMEEIKRSKYQNFVVSDMGFQFEWEAMISQPDIKYGLVEINRLGCSYKNDSRGSLKPFGPFEFISLSKDQDNAHASHMDENYWVVTNDSDIDYLKDTVNTINEEFFR